MVANHATFHPMSQQLRKYRNANKISLESFGRHFGVNKSTISRWELDKIPPEKVLKIEKITSIPRHKLRPDIYPLEKNRD